MARDMLLDHAAMLTLRRAEDRHHHRRGKQEAWQTFHPQDGKHGVRTDPFGILENLDEHRLPPGAHVPRQPPSDAEILTYVHEGALAHEDSWGRSGVIHAGEFQRMTALRRVRHQEVNASRADPAHVFQIRLCPCPADLGPSDEHKRFSTAERRGTWCIVGSPDGRRGSLRLHADAVLYAAILAPGQHLIHELSQGRCAWLHLVQGEATLGDVVLTTADGAGIADERAVSVTARQETELLLLDLGRGRGDQ